jgi:hypothetical protein
VACGGLAIDYAMAAAAIPASGRRETEPRRPALRLSALRQHQRHSHHHHHDTCHRDHLLLCRLQRLPTTPAASLRLPPHRAIHSARPRPSNMPSQGYERVRCRSPSHPPCARGPLSRTRHDDADRSLQVAGDDDHDSSPSPVTAHGTQQWPPASPPPSFHSRASSPNGGASRRLLSDDPLANDEDRTLADTFDSDSDDDEDADGRDDRQRLMRATPRPDDEPATPGIQRRVTEIPVFNTQTPSSGRVYGGGNGGVWANLSAKPTRGEDAEEKPPVRASTLQSPPYLTVSRHTNKLPQTQRRRTGKPPYLRPARLATRSSLKASPSALSSASFGTP